MEIVTREAWGARPPRKSANIPLPTPELWLHHSAGNHKGPEGVRNIQNFHLDGRGWWDIAYSFLIDPSTLTVYEGRGEGKLGGHTFGRNSKSHGICVMGNFENTDPSIKLVSKIAELVKYGHEQGWWPPQLSGGHRDVRATQCPGKLLYARIDDINRAALTTQTFPSTGEATKIDRLAQRVWDMEMLALIDHSYRYHTGRTPSRSEMNAWLDVAGEEGAGHVLFAISHSTEAMEAKEESDTI